MCLQFYKELASVNRSLRRATEQMIQAISALKSGDTIVCIEISYLNTEKISARLMEITEELWELPNEEYQILDNVLDEIWAELDFFKRFRRTFVQYLE